jgi:hypothetical protein
MQLSNASLLTSLLAALALASPLSRRDISRPCFHAGSDALCCAKPPLQIDQILETNCSVRKSPILHDLSPRLSRQRHESIFATTVWRQADDLSIFFFFL